jgi:hypothetical protein
MANGCPLRDDIFMTYYLISHRMRTRAVLICFITCITSLSGVDSNGQEVPKAVKELVFEGAPFARQIMLSLPPEDNRANLERQQQDAPAEKRSDTGYLGGKVYVFVNGQQGFSAIDKAAMAFLVKNNLAHVEQFIRYEGQERGMVKVNALFYDDALKPLVVSPENRSAPFSGRFNIAMGKRELVSVDYVNNYDGTLPMTGAKTRYTALNFSYRIVPLIPTLPKLDVTFHGKAKGFLNPDTGRWELMDDVELSENLNAVLTTWIEQNVSTQDNPVSNSPTQNSPPPTESSEDLRRANLYAVSQAIQAAVHESEKLPRGFERANDLLARLKRIDTDKVPEDMKRAVADYIAALGGAIDARKDGRDPKSYDAATAEAKERVIAAMKW